MQTITISGPIDDLTYLAVDSYEIGNAIGILASIPNATLNVTGHSLEVTAPFGVQGWVKIHALSAPVTNLCRFPVWWLERAGEWRSTAVVAAKAHANSLVARLEQAVMAQTQAT